MKNFKKVTISIVSIVLVLLISIFIYKKYFHDENRLSIQEQRWISDNKTNLININVPNKLNIFGYDGEGVFFDFLENIETKHDISFNKVAIDNYEIKDDLGFYINETINDKDLLLHKDYYVVIGKNEEVITSFDNLKGSKIATTSYILSRITPSYNVQMSYQTFENYEEVIDSFKNEEVKYIILPKIEVIDVLVEYGYTIVHHLSDLSINYFIKLGNDKTLNNIIKKYYNNWYKNNYETSFYEKKFNLLTKKLSLNQAEIDTLTNRKYKYGFIENAPYETVASTNYGGIAFSYIEEFQKLSSVEFVFDKFNNIERLVKSFNERSVDLIFDNNNFALNHAKIYTNLNNEFFIISPLKNSLVMSNINQLAGETVGVMKNSKLHHHLSSVPKIDLKTYSSEKDLFRAAKKGMILAVDSHFYNYNINKNIKKYSISLRDNLKENYSYRYINNTDAFYKLFKTYINLLDDNQLIKRGIVSYNEVAKSGNIISAIARYTLFIITGLLVLGAILYYSKNKLKLNIKIKKDQKLKFIDVLTSLKNRNYLNEQKDSWNLNNIYPQAVIILDLNNIKYLNDTLGHTEGDKQIKAAANILIRTQLDNSEIIRTDGNEFMVYLIGYSEKQILNYIKKLNKEFRELPHEDGAAFGFSVIEDDLKLIDDAINEATILMRENKENLGAKK